ncbi:methylaspartate ammonia-lyase [Erythrobacter sp. HL-111]|uniref:methylaspartate ammonia-lyase n=1 Tax=Erythrobacter sp. HL-111 TaxID=1798193 RepID=UPI0006D9764F|nr:methylaspartate ammonia-lyase [Erythrobacter sp. HL-111]KPP96285.1 MAG: methylaspartate ammonia-lyase [Erythrobacteraceae bacterium HL-111]SDR74856.1 methylaspartate ammonia-lyase [Erythrobacter sp. HL-111]
MHIEKVIFAPARGGFFYDDQAAIRAGREMDGVAYLGEPLTPGFTSVREPARALGIGLVLEDGAVVWGDMVSVQYSGAAGRDPVFDPRAIEAVCRARVVPQLIGMEAAAGPDNCARAFAHGDEPRLPLAIEYGVSQALLRAAAHARRVTVAEVVAEALGLPAPGEPVPIFAQSGDDRRNAVDTMILKQVDILPHGLINSAGKFGADGAAFIDYVRWVAGRIEALGAPGYRPVLHFDVYGWIGLGHSDDPRAVAEFIARLAARVPDHTLQIECPVDYGSRAATIENYAAIVEALDGLTDKARIVADEHCNTLADIEAFIAARAAHVIQVKTPDVGDLMDTARAIRAAREAGIGAYCGGTSAETDHSARACVHVALAARASMMLAKPGMGVNEGLTIVGNEQARALAQIAARRS